MKANPHNFEAFIDPAGGEWIRIKVGQYKDTVWRPADISMSEDGQVSYKIEFLGEAVEAVAFDKMANSIIHTILLELAGE